MGTKNITAVVVVKCIHNLSTVLSIHETRTRIFFAILFTEPSSLKFYVSLAKFYLLAWNNVTHPLQLPTTREHNAKKSVEGMKPRELNYLHISIYFTILKCVFFLFKAGVDGKTDGVI